MKGEREQSRFEKHLEEWFDVLSATVEYLLWFYLVYLILGFFLAGG